MRLDYSNREASPVRSAAASGSLVIEIEDSDDEAEEAATATNRSRDYSPSTATQAPRTPSNVLVQQQQQRLAALARADNASRSSPRHVTAIQSAPIPKTQEQRSYALSETDTTSPVLVLRPTVTVQAAQTA